MTRTRLKSVAIVAGVLVALTGLGLAYAPIVYAELAHLTHSLPDWPPSLIAEPPPGPRSGSVVDGYWRVFQIAQNTYAIGEPEAYPDNFEYLLIGSDRALLIDAGATARDIHPALATLTRLPVTVIPTHLHYDHTNGLRNFSSIALIDLPQTRSRVEQGVFHFGRYEYMGSRGRDPPLFRVTEWVKPNAYIDLGQRRLQLLWTPGHTVTSISIHDPGARLLFTGDLIYPTTLYAFMPDSSLSTYVATADRLLETLPADTILYGAHCCRNDGPPAAPWLDMQDLRDVRRAVQDIRSGSADGRGFILRRYPVNTRMTLVTLFPFGNR